MTMRPFMSIDKESYSTYVLAEIVSLAGCARQHAQLGRRNFWSR